MVVFACNACGSSLKKNQVERHYTQQCRRCEAVSCMDCGKDFWGEEFKTHVKCISEDEKYGGQNYVPKASANKGEKKQEQWIEHVNSVIAEQGKTMDPKLRSLLENIVQYPNIPRKKAKFQNFCMNSIRGFSPNLIERAWDIFSSSKEVKNQGDKENAGAATAKTDGESAGATAQTQNGHADGEDAKNGKLSKREKKELRRKEHDKVEKKDKKKNELKRRAAQDEDDDDGGNNDDKEEQSAAEEKPKKKKRKKQQTDGETAEEEAADDSRPAENGHESILDQSTLEESSILESPDAVGTGEDGEKMEEKEENKKKKKKKGQQKGEESSASAVEGAADMDGDVASQAKTGKKAKKRKIFEDEIAEREANGENEAPEETEELSSPPSAGKPKKFKWESVISEVLTSAPGHELPVKKLRKKVLAEYESRGGEGKGAKSLEWAFARFEKKLQNASLFKVAKDRVKLVNVPGEGDD